MGIMSDAPDFYSGFFQPESAANTDYQPVYPYNNSKITASGHMFEFDDTQGRERIRLQHRANTFIEMQPNGDEVHKVYGDGYEIVVKDKHVQILGKCIVEIVGDAYIHVQGDKVETVDGSVTQHIKGNYTQIVEGLSSVTSVGDMTIEAGSGIAGSLNISAGDVVSLDADLRVRGEVAADKIYSYGRIDTSETGGISAGLAGFYSLLGGLTIGVPIPPAPGNILCVGTITAGSSMIAPTAEFGLMTAGLMTDTINTGLYDVHTHAAYGGPTSPPTPKMI